MSSTEKVKLRVSSLKKTYPTPAEDLVVLDGVDLEMEAGESLAVMGPSGAGKSTLLHILGALEVPTSGRVELGGEEPFSFSPRALARFRNRRTGFVFQDHHLLPQCTVLENVLIPTLVAEGVTAGAEAWARALLDRVGLSARLEHRPSELSGGEKQRVAIARALIHKPFLLLCDEPTGNLDAASARAVRDLLFELHRDEQNILITVTHSLELAARFQRRLELRGGRLEQGRAAL
jgi:lipoprotein-releasing system ATP-binding protein